MRSSPSALQLNIMSLRLNGTSVDYDSTVLFKRMFARKVCAACYQF